MKKIVFFISVFIISQFTAQFDFSTGNDVTLNITQPYETIDIHCKPNPISDMTINWDLIEISSTIPEEWTFTICDIICYPFFSDHGNPINFTSTQFTNGEYYKLKLGVSVNGVEGLGYVKYYISDVNNTSYGDTAIFHLNYQSNSINESDINKEDFKWSISDDKFSLFSNSGEVISYKLYSTEGVLLINSKFQDQTSIEINLKKGIYFLQLEDQKTVQIVNF